MFRVFVNGRLRVGMSQDRKWQDALANTITEVRDNSGLELAPGDRIRHKDFGEGRVETVSGAGAKRVAEVRFDSAGKKRMLVKIAPIEKLQRARSAGVVIRSSVAGADNGVEVVFSRLSPVEEFRRFFAG